MRELDKINHIYKRQVYLTKEVIPVLVKSEELSKKVGDKLVEAGFNDNEEFRLTQGDLVKITTIIDMAIHEFVRENYLDKLSAHEMVIVTNSLVPVYCNMKLRLRGGGQSDVEVS